MTNRGRLLPAIQTLEAASIIGLIRRTQALIGRVGTVAGVLGIFRRRAVLEAGGFDGRMATEDIELSWRLLLAGWHDDVRAERARRHAGSRPPSAPSGRSAAAGRAGRARCCIPTWARCGGGGTGGCGRLAGESFASLLWVTLAVIAFAFGVLDAVIEHDLPYVQLGLAWGVAISVVATFQLGFAIWIERRYDPVARRAFMLGPLYPFGYWLISRPGRAALGGAGPVPRPRRASASPGTSHASALPDPDPPRE